MHSLLTGMLISMITVFFAMWFLSSSILKQLQASGTSSLVQNYRKTQQTSEARYSAADNRSTGGDSYAQSDAQWNGPYRTRASGSPFGPKLSLKQTSNPFSPKLSLRGRTSPQWGRERKPETRRKQSKPDASAQKKTDYSNMNASEIISSFKDYVDLLNDISKE